MATIWYYKNVRFDGGVRTGLDVNDDRIFQEFRSGSEAEDPSLLWFVEVQCEGTSLPTEPDAAREWFLRHTPTTRAKLADVADRLTVGIDELSMPFVQSWTDASEHVTFRIRCSAIRRLSGLEIARHLREVAANLESEIRALPRADLLAV
jgi:hypothetical protein